MHFVVIAYDGTDEQALERRMAEQLGVRSRAAWGQVSILDIGS